MIQIFPRISNNISYGNSVTYWSTIGGENHLSDTFGAAISRIPVPWAVTVRNLVIYSRDTTRTKDIRVIVQKNGVNTLLDGTLPFTSNGPVIVSGIDVSFNPLDDLNYVVSTAGAASPPGYKVAFCLELESIGNIFGLPSSPGGVSVGSGRYGGALGNGILSDVFSLAVVPTNLSNSYSICSVPGNITTLALKSYPGALSIGASVKGYIRLNGILQDGSPGTVDTLCEITAGNITAISTFILPIVPPDHVEVAYVRAGVAAPFSLVGIGGSVGFIPTVDGHFMLTGGNTAVVGFPLGYKWNSLDATIQTTPLAPIGPSGLAARGLYVEDSIAPGVDNSFTHTIQHNENPTPIQVVVSGLNKTGLITGLYEEYLNADTITLERLATSGASSTSRLFWGLNATLPDVDPPPIVNGTIIVQKLINNGNYPDVEFGIIAGGGLSPDTFILKQNENRIFDEVVPGNGYSINENVLPAGFGLVSITTNNGSPSNNITVGEGETVVVTITNTFVPVESSGIYKLVPGKRNDTLWTDVDAGTTRDVKIPNPFIKTGLIGE